jgi:hypothetical protein
MCFTESAAKIEEHPDTIRQLRQGFAELRSKFEAFAVGLQNVSAQGDRAALLRSQFSSQGEILHFF